MSEQLSHATIPVESDSTLWSESDAALPLSHLQKRIQRALGQCLLGVSYRPEDHLWSLESTGRGQWHPNDSPHLRCESQDGRTDTGESRGSLPRGQRSSDKKLSYDRVPVGRTVVICKKKEARLSALEKLQALYGDQWVWISFDPIHKVVIAFVVGRRIQKNADRLLAKTKRRSDAHLPFFTSDELRHYDDAIIKAYGRTKTFLPTGRPGRPRTPILIPPRGLLYAQVVKKRRKGRVIEITSRVVFGTQRAVLKRLKDSPVSEHINTTFVERNNLTLRHHNRRLTRKTIAFSKKRERLEQQLHLSLAYYHFVKPHLGLRLVLPKDQNKKYQNRTPAMSAGLTDHIWTMCLGSGHRAHS